MKKKKHKILITLLAIVFILPVLVYNPLSVRVMTLGVAIYYGLDVPIFYRQIKAESGFRSFAVSGKSAIGLGQMMESTAFYIHQNHRRGLLFVPFYNLRLAAKYNLYLLKRFGGNYSLALAAYNWGETKVSKRIKGIKIDPAKDYRHLFTDIDETYAYIGRIIPR